MREILFRGVPIDKNCEWKTITGSLVLDIHGNVSIYHPLNTPLGGFRVVPVIPETVSQFTGLCDKNGVKIFEHDVVEMWGKNHEIKFMNGAFEFIKSDCKKQNLIDTTVCKVIGNIHDNKELIC